MIGENKEKLFEIVNEFNPGAIKRYERLSRRAPLSKRNIECKILKAKSNGVVAGFLLKKYYEIFEGYGIEEQVEHLI